MPRSPTPGRDGRWSSALVAGLVAVLGIVVTAVLATATWAAHASNEDRLLHQRTREVGAVLTTAIPGVQTPIVSAALLAEGTNGDPVVFRQLAAPLIAKSRPFASVSLWSATDSAQGPLVVVGKQPRLATEPVAESADLFARRPVAVDGRQRPAAGPPRAPARVRRAIAGRRAVRGLRGVGVPARPARPGRQGLGVRRPRVRDVPRPAGRPRTPARVELR